MRKLPSDKKFIVKLLANEELDHIKTLLTFKTALQKNDKWIELSKKQQRRIRIPRLYEGKGSIPLVEYQEGSVVSRTIIDKEMGTVNIFAFNKGQGLSEHTTPYDALVYILDGNAEIVISGKGFQLKEDEMVIMPANEPHSLNAIKKFKMLLMMIRS